MARVSEPSPLGFRKILLSALVSGLVAGACLAVFHLALTEPVIEEAIAQEAARAGGHAAEPPLVSRELQRLGLVVGLLLYGGFWAFLFGLAFFVGQRALPWSSRLGQGLVSGLLGAWALGIFPFLKYPANPPGVGDPETIALRQALFLGFLALSSGGVALALAGWAASERVFPGRPWARALLITVGYGVFAAALCLALPANPDPVSLSAELVGRFRALSLGGVVLFWLVLGLAFGLIVGRAEGGRPLRPAVGDPLQPLRKG